MEIILLLDLTENKLFTEAEFNISIYTAVLYYQQLDFFSYYLSLLLLCLCISSTLALCFISWYCTYTVI